MTIIIDGGMLFNKNVFVTNKNQETLIQGLRSQLNLLRYTNNKDNVDKIKDKIEVFSHIPKRIHLDTFLHSVLTDLSSIVKKFPNHSDIVIALDSSGINWRRKQFPNYKVLRRNTNDKSDIDWEYNHEIINETVKQLSENLPYPLVSVKGLEADDIIAYLCNKSKDTNEKIVVVSEDSDLFQLKFTNKNITQYSLNKNNFIGSKYTYHDFETAVLRGERSDSIPNIHSNDNFFEDYLNGCTDRQKSVTKKFIESFNLSDYSPDTELYKNYTRNELLMKLYELPEYVNEMCEDIDISQKDVSVSGMADFIIKYGGNSVKPETFGV